jgi:hypothetical protein
MEKKPVLPLQFHEFFIGFIYGFAGFKILQLEPEQQSSMDLLPHAPLAVLDK